ncbi:MAG TPA: AAA family ATPase [Nocardioides sp.]|uniref:helix-turn-helix transcriptional regulator n=1 Tax=Nocardioides sp. TaxID=35761 RepID=UPI002CAAB396|nr:AAA family ATPase [Nocardioides sp.]HQR25453.1 AAA family ATPase [Nocardioides sp.]
MELLERDHELAALDAAVSGARDGEGSGIAVAGESGAGKSAVLDSVCRTHAQVRVLRASCDPLLTPRPLGPFRDLARDGGLDTALRREGAPLAGVCEGVFDTLRAQPTVLVVEDLHWIDTASADVLRFLARRVGSMPLALLVSYRDHEIAPRHPVLPLLGDFALLDDLTTLQLGPLSVHGVEKLVAGTRLVPELVHARTGGNPFFVSEVAKDPDRPLPSSVRDAVLARTAGVAPEDIEVLQLVATAPDRLDDRVLPALGVDLPTLRRLDATGLVVRARGGLVFRHELAREAVESTIPPGGAPQLHARLLDALEQVGSREPALLTHHAVGARDPVRTARHALAAAHDASRAGSHSEAAAFFETALSQSEDVAPRQRADRLQRLSFEQYMTSRLGEAIGNVRATFPLWETADDRVGLSAAHETCAIFEYYNAHRQQAEAHADLAARIAREVGSAERFGAARATRGFLAYLRGQLQLAERCLDDARRVAAPEGMSALVLRIELVQELVALVGGDAAARGRLASHIETARSRGWDELASTGYSQLCSLDVEQRRLRSAEHVLEESLPFTVERDIPICRHWQTGVRSRLHFAHGHWQAALEDATRVLNEEGMPVATVWPSLVNALVPLRRDGVPDAEGHLDRAWSRAVQIDEPTGILAVLSALAEQMWMTGEDDPRVTQRAPDELRRLGGAPNAPWAAGDLAVWLDRLGLVAEVPGAVAEPFAHSLAGRYDEAASWWHRAGEPFAEAMAWGDSAEPGRRVRAVELLDRLGATGTADRHRARLRRDGVARVPPRPRARTRANPAGLTNRQLEVANLVARGFTNAEIASRLYISPKTADHHVSAVLGKLGLPNRRAVVVQSDELGLG